MSELIYAIKNLFQALEENFSPQRVNKKAKSEINIKKQMFLKKNGFMKKQKDNQYFLLFISFMLFEI